MAAEKIDGYLSLENVGVVFDTANGPFRAVRAVRLRIARGEFVSIIGHSGCGKSTVLNVIAGLVPAAEGGVLLNNREVDGPGPDRAVVFQNHALLPWLTVYDNVRLAVDKVFAGTKSKAERDAWTRHNLRQVQMEHAADKRPHELSGGMKQRVGIARALAMEPKVLLMDEPFGALDALTRARLQDALADIQAALGNTVIMITHDVDEAVLLSDRIVMMANGGASGAGPAATDDAVPAAAAGATIGEVLTVALPRPRRRLELAESPDYHRCRAAVLKFLHRVEPAQERAA